VTQAVDRRDVILERAADLFARQGVAATTVREIADAVGILSGSLYHHFASKDEIVDAIVGFSHVGVQLTKQTLRSSLEATSFGGHMEHEGLAQLYVRLLTKNFEEAIVARREGRAPEFLA